MLSRRDYNWLLVYALSIDHARREILSRLLSTHAYLLLVVNQDSFGRLVQNVWFNDFFELVKLFDQVLNIEYVGELIHLWWKLNLESLELRIHIVLYLSKGFVILDLW